MEEVVRDIAKRYLRLVHDREGFIGAACPFHKGGKETHPSFWINKQTGEWGCFTCPEHGRDLKSLLVGMGVSSFRVDEELKEAKQEEKKNEAVNTAIRQSKKFASFEGRCKLPGSLLGVFDWCPLYLVDAGFTPELLKEHDIGFDKKRAKITFPIRDLYGNLIGISGRAVDDSEPKYKVYEGVKMDEKGKPYPGELGEEFPEYSSDGIRDHLWRAHKVFPRLYGGPVDHGDEYLIIVEGYKACLWLVQCGWINTVALMGARMSGSQERIVRMLGVPTWVLLDNNEPGIAGADSVCRRLGDSTFPVFRCRYPEWCDDKVQPDNLTAEQLNDVLQHAERIGGRRYGHYQKHARGDQKWSDPHR